MNVVEIAIFFLKSKVLDLFEMQWWHVESVSHSGEMASDTMSQKSVESSSLGTSEGKSTLHADLSRRLRQWVKRPRKQVVQHNVRLIDNSSQSEFKKHLEDDSRNNSRGFV